jgi:hypothetical protein
MKAFTLLLPVIFPFTLGTPAPLTSISEPPSCLISYNQSALSISKSFSHNNLTSRYVSWENCNDERRSRVLEAGKNCEKAAKLGSDYAMSGGGDDFYWQVGDIHVIYSIRLADRLKFRFRYWFNTDDRWYNRKVSINLLKISALCSRIRDVIVLCEQNCHCHGRACTNGRTLFLCDGVS